MPRSYSFDGGFPRSPSKEPLPYGFKEEVQKKVDDFIDATLRPKYVQPPPEDPKFNYLIDITARWVRKTLFFYVVYQVVFPGAPEPTFEDKFARMEYAGRSKFHLSFARYTGQWIQIYTDQTLDECLEAIRDDPYFSI